jgi:hypothetical protein
MPAEDDETCLLQGRWRRANGLDFSAFLGLVDKKFRVQVIGPLFGSRDNALASATSLSPTS